MFTARAKSWEEKEKEDLTKLGSWEIVCNRLYQPWDQRHWIGGDSYLLPTAGLRSTFLHLAVTGKLFQTPEDWKDLQRRLRCHGYSDDLTLLKESMKVPPEEKNDDSKPAMAADATKRVVMDCYDNGDSQTNIQDQSNKRMKLSQERTAQVVLADDGTMAKAASGFSDAPQAEENTGGPIIVEQNVQADFATPRLGSEQSKNLKSSAIGVSPPENDPRSVAEMDRSPSEPSKSNNKGATSSCPGELKDLGAIGGNTDRDYASYLRAWMNNPPPDFGRPYSLDQLFHTASNRCGPKTNDEGTASPSPAPEYPSLGDTSGYRRMTDYLRAALNDPPPTFGGLHPVDQPSGTASNSSGPEPSQMRGKRFASSSPVPEYPGLGDSYGYRSRMEILSQLVSAMNDQPASFGGLYPFGQPLRTASNSRGPEPSTRHDKATAASYPAREYPGLGHSYGCHSTREILARLCSAMNDPPPSFSGLYSVDQVLRSARNNGGSEPSQASGKSFDSSPPAPEHPGLGDSYGDILSHLRSAMDDPPPSFERLHPVGQPLRATSSMSDSRGSDLSQTNCTSAPSPCPVVTSLATVGPASSRPPSSDTEPSETNIKEVAYPSPAQRKDYHFGCNQSVTGTTTFTTLNPSRDTQKEVSSTALQNVSCPPLLIDLTQTEDVPSPIDFHQDQGNSILAMNIPSEIDERMYNESKTPLVHSRSDTDEAVVLSRQEDKAGTPCSVGDDDDEVVVHPVVLDHDRADVAPFLQDRNKRSVRGVITVAASAVIALLWSLFGKVSGHWGEPCNPGFPVDISAPNVDPRIQSRENDLAAHVDQKLETWLGTMGHLSERMNRDGMDRVDSPWHGVMIITFGGLVLTIVWVTVTLGIMAAIWIVKELRGRVML